MKKIRLGDYCEISAGGDKPINFSESKTNELNIPVIANSSDNKGIVGYTDEAKITQKSVTITARGSCGFPHYRTTPYVPIIRLISVIPNDENILDTQYLYYLLKLKPFRGIGSVQSQITVPQLEDYQVDIVDDINIQREIAKCLGSIDRKIEINNKINTVLETTMRTIYDYWFLQFEFPNDKGKPYKSSGGKMVYNEKLKREIPEGWTAIKLVNILEKVNRDFNYEEDVKTYDLSNMPTNSIAIVETSSSNNFETNLFSVKTGDLLFGSIRPYLKKAGLASYDGAVAGTIHCYEVKNKIDYNLALFTISSENFFKFAINNSKGTKMPVVASNDLLEFIVPYNEEIVEKFNSISISDKIIANVRQTNELADLRNFLMPLLFNGQVSFKKDIKYEK
ncbi:MAG TPA: hypothetical protein GXZ48_00320 [Acholeplasmataceae bacterium]|jgi:type I restriction enzyme S subunit|nr:hypothetical protein [Acholeplasmataceae bacterium]